MDDPASDDDGDLLEMEARESLVASAEDELLGRPHPYWQDYLSGVSRVSAAEVLAAAKTYLQPESMRVLTVGRWSEIAANTGPGDSGLEVLIGHARTPLPTRDPLTLAVPSGN